MQALYVMTTIEQRIIWLGMAIMLGYLVVYQFFFIPQFSGNEPYVGEAAIAYLGWFTVGTTLACVVLLLRDLKRRDISGKAGWFIGIVFLTWVGLPYYFFKHARRPLPNAI